MWDSVREELRTFRRLMPLARTSWTDRWLPMVYAVDASLSGYGVSVSEWKLSDVSEVARVMERR